MERYGGVAGILENDKNPIGVKILFVTGVSANDIFIYGMAKWLKQTMDVEIDVFEMSHSDQQNYDNRFYNHVETPKTKSAFLIKGVTRPLQPYFMGCQLKKYLKGKYYDIIHCHWLIPQIIVETSLNRYCKKLLATFWGGEFDKVKLFQSHKLYLKKLSTFLQSVDGVINSRETEVKLKYYFPKYNGEFYAASFGSEPLDNLYDLMESESKTVSKSKIGIEANKKTILIGYSGKRLHRHLQVIEALCKAEDLKTRLHILAPMTRNIDAIYNKEVKATLEKSGYSYTIIEGFLESEDIARLRNATDIVMQFSEFDGFSRSIIECICSGALMVYANWLDYKERLNNCGFTAFPAKDETAAIDVIRDYMKNEKGYQKALNDNRINGRNQFQWSECIKDWIKAYNDILS